MKCLFGALLCFMMTCAEAQWTVVDLHPAGATSSPARGVHSGQQHYTQKESACSSRSYITTMRAELRDGGNFKT
ncbi:MAG: hypothetical protein ACR2HJ_05600 [Fimbriimonadales bacterium]